MKYTGIDGCKARWLAVPIDDSGDVVFKLIFDINALPEYFSDVKAGLIDIPIGLHTQHPEQSV